MPTFNFPIHELNDSPTEEITRSGITAVRRFLIPWNNRVEFAIGMTSNTGLFGLLPPSYPAFPIAVVDKISFSPFGDRPDFLIITDPAVQLNSYSAGACLAVITYSPAEFPDKQEQDDDLPSGTWATYRMRFSGEFLTIPGRSMFWKDNGNLLPPDAQPAISIPITEHIVSWHKVRRPPWTAIGELRGQANNAAFKVPATSQTIAKETLLFEGADSDAEFSINPDDPLTWNLTYTFKEKAPKGFDADSVSPGWNHAFRDDPGGWARPVTGVIGDKPPYALGDFKKLFAFE